MILRGGAGEVAVVGCSWELRMLVRRAQGDESETHKKGQDRAELLEGGPQNISVPERKTGNKPSCMVFLGIFRAFSEFFRSLANDKEGVQNEWKHGEPDGRGTQKSRKTVTKREPTGSRRAETAPASKNITD